MHLAAEPSSVPTARTVVENALGSVASLEVIEDVRLLTSEVTSNAVRHARTPIGLGLDVVVDLTLRRVRVEVLDGGVGFDPPTTGRPQTYTRGTKVGGYGLYLIDLLSDRWGTLADPRFGVWFERDLDPG